MGDPSRPRSRILVVEDDEVIRENLVECLTEEGYEVIAAGTGEDGVALARARNPNLVVCDITLPAMDGYEVLRALRQGSVTATLPFIFLTAKAERNEIRTGMNLGADDYLTKPFALSELIEAIHTRLQRSDELTRRASDALAREERAIASVPSSGVVAAEGVVVSDPRMRELYAQAARAAPTNINVLILGETGVGKEILARAIHNQSARKRGPCIAINCAALTESLLESELFGHERGAFTGALQARPGLVESASGGTVFLDEVGEMPLSIQTKLLRVLEERKVMRVGARTTQEVDVRFVAATNRDLEEEARCNRFRPDLFYRLNGISFTVPPLRDRPSEIAPLCRMFLTRTSVELGKSETLRISQACIGALEQYHWPGNLRELRNVIERGAVLCEGSELQLEHLPPKVLGQTEGQPSSNAPALGRRERLENEMQDLERQRIQSALDQAGGNQTAAAEILGVSRRTLVYRLTALGLSRPRKRL